MLRIDAAKQMMSQDSTMRIKDIALILGYKDQYYFSRVFKSITGIPPSDYHHASEAE
jgi:YesN/AraC family two-component response regulator